MSYSITKHIPLPPKTPAFMCEYCGAVALSPTGVCKVQGRVTRKDWCGSESISKPKICENGVNTHRFSCKECGRVANNPELLCEPMKLE